ncbi:MAG: CDP-alcohol phosphatidyltransferase family protein [Polyangiaceae bacterium]|nr:CDP-alcohol phosphatidyltransferase family protein [Polyangiaceae bacterium]
MHLPPVSARDLKLPPNMVSLARIPLAVLFPFVIVSPGAAFAVLLAAALTDVVDGYLARKNNQVTALGAIIDPIADKTFAVTVVVTLIVTKMLPLWAVPALLVREIFELPLVLWVLATRRSRDKSTVKASANVLGKLATVIQFGAVMSALAWPEALHTLLGLAALAGAFAGIAYWVRALRQMKRAPEPVGE